MRLMGNRRLADGRFISLFAKNLKCLERIRSRRVLSYNMYKYSVILVIK